MTFTWIPFYKEFAQKLLQFRIDKTCDKSRLLVLAMTSISSI